MLLSEDSLLGEICSIPLGPQSRMLTWPYRDGRAGFTYPGANTTITFANDSISVFQTMARIPGNFTGVTNGESAFQRFCTNPTAVTAAPAPAAPTFKPGQALNNSLVLKNFPKAQVIASDGSASGYYLKSQANSDVGVIFLPSFEPNTPAEMQAVIQTMIAEMKRDGKTKLIIDLQGNGGGIILNGFDAFRQLFPQTQDVMLARQRVQPIYSALAEVTTQRFANFSAAKAPTTTDNDLKTIDQSLSHFNINFDLAQNRTKFTSFPEKFGPNTVNGDQVTNLQQWDWGDPFLTSNEVIGAGMTVTGYGNRQNFTQPFAAQDIVLLYDGVCASTCTLFSEMMRNLGGVKSIAMGGRPSNTQIQGVGGVKGSQSLSFAGIFGIAQGFLQAAPNTSVSATTIGINTTPFSSTQLEKLRQLSDLPMNRSLDNGINFSDQILKGNLQDGVPAQFVQEKADCRMFITPAMVTTGGLTTAMEAMWEAAADRAFRGKACVVGGISSGMVNARTGEQVEVRAMDVTVKEADDARSYLDSVRMKAVMEPVERSAAWWEKNGRAVPAMHLV